MIVHIVLYNSIEVKERKPELKEIVQSACAGMDCYANAYIILRWKLPNEYERKSITSLEELIKEVLSNDWNRTASFVVAHGELEEYAVVLVCRPEVWQISTDFGVDSSAVFLLELGHTNWQTPTPW